MKNIIPAAILGAVMGIASKAADVAAQGSVMGNIAWSFGLLSSGILIWCVIGYFIACAVDRQLPAALVNGGFFLGMLTAYYIYSFTVVGYFSPQVVAFWAAMAAAAAAGTVLVKKFRARHWFKVFSITAAVIMTAADVLFIYGFELLPTAAELVLLVAMIFMAAKKDFFAKTS